MKEMKFLVLSLVMVALLYPACRKEKGGGTAIEQQTVRSGETFTYQIGLIGIEDQIRISEAPRHAALSVLERNSSGAYEYRYQSHPEFTGEDAAEVTIDISNGARVVNQQVIRFQFRVQP